MSDDADMAQDQMDREQELRKKYKPRGDMEVHSIGYCLNCSEPLPMNIRWCDHECQIDWEKRRARM
jgi:RNA polymerase-binding transcription factor DksA